MARNLVIGDVHAMYGRLMSVLSCAHFDPENDTLYAVGDFCDRGPEPVKVLDYLMSLPHFLPVVGNHDMWLYEYLCGDGPAPIWLDPRNGGRVTYEGFRDVPFEKRERIRKWYGSFPLLRVAGNNVILHAGPPREAADMDSLIALTRGITLSSAYAEKPAGPRYRPLIHDIVGNLIGFGFNGYYTLAADYTIKFVPYPTPKLVYDIYQTMRELCPKN